MVEAGSFVLEVPPPLDLAATLESGQAHRWQKDGDVYWGVVYGSLLKVKTDSGGGGDFFYSGPVGVLKDDVGKLLPVRR